MIRTLSLVMGLWSAMTACAQADLRIELVLNEPGAGGTLHVAICPDAASYSAEQGCMLRDARASGTLVVVDLKGISPGTYAVKVFHDVNDNGRLDTNWLGIPTEPYGFSNDAMGTFGPPGFEGAAFKVRAERTTVRIQLKG